MWRLATIVIGLAACGRLDFDPTPVDAPVLGPWGAPTPVDLGGMTAFDDPSITADGLDIVVNQGTKVLVSTRPTTSDPWSAPVQFTSLPAVFYSPHISDDGLTLWGANGTDIVVTTRSVRTDSWGPATVITEVSSAADDDGPAVTSDQLFMVLDSSRSGARHLHMASRASIAVPWGTPVELAEIGVAVRPDLSADKLTIYFEVAGDIYEARRASTADPFDPRQPVTEVNSAANDQDPWVSNDQHHMVFLTLRTGKSELWESWR